MASAGEHIQWPDSPNTTRNLMPGFRGGDNTLICVHAYGTHVDEIHHIIQATHAEFIRRDISFKCPNGLVERVKVDRHLKVKVMGYTISKSCIRNVTESKAKAKELKSTAAIHLATAKQRIETELMGEV